MAKKKPEDDIKVPESKEPERPKVHVIGVGKKTEIYEVPLGMPMLGNASLESLVDDLARARQLKKVAEKLEGIFKEAIKGRRHAEDFQFDGEEFHLDINTRTAMRFDKDAVIKEMGQEWYDAHCKPSSYEVYLTKPR